jgi:hypothetical protein
MHIIIYVGVRTGWGFARSLARSGVGFLRRDDDLRHPFTGSAHSMLRFSLFSISPSVTPARSGLFTHTTTKRRLWERGISSSSSRGQVSGFECHFILFALRRIQCVRVCRGRCRLAHNWVKFCDFLCERGPFTSTYTPHAATHADAAWDYWSRFVAFYISGVAYSVRQYYIIECAKIIY